MTRLLLAVLFIGFAGFVPSAQTTLKVMSYNIRYDNPDDGENRWALRRQFLADQINFYGPDVLGIQEGLVHQVRFLDSALVGYDFVGVGRDDGRMRGEFSAIFYRTDRFRVVESSTFWLSETPDKVSKGWDAALERICTYALMEETGTRKRFWVFNTHFDHVGMEARVNSAELIAAKAADLNQAGHPVFITGDFNLPPDTEPIRRLSSKFTDARHSGAAVVLGNEGTFNGFKFLEPLGERIDYIFVSNEVRVRKYAVLSDSKDLKYPSDHLPVFVEAEIP